MVSTLEIEAYLSTRRTIDRPEPTPMATPAQIAANQANAAKSTGPKTAEGKDASRRNALKHGLAAEKLVLPEQEAEVIAARIAAWTPSLQPKDEHDSWLVEEVVVNSVRIDRCFIHETALRTRAAERASLCWEVDRECEAEELGERLAKSPAKVLRSLRRTRQGCAWLISRWEGLGRILEAKGDWDGPQKRLALDLLGTPKEFREGPTPLDGDRRALLRDQLAELDALKAGSLDELDEHDRADAEIGLGAAVDKAIELSRRYEAACVRRLHRALNQLRSGRKTAHSAPQRSAPAPAPEPDRVAQAEAAELARLVAEFAAEEAKREALIAAPAPAPAPVPAPAPAAAPRGNRKTRRALKALARKA